MATGELLLGYALRILALSEEAHALLHPSNLEGVVRLRCSALCVRRLTA